MDVRTLRRLKNELDTFLRGLVTEQGYSRVEVVHRLGGTAASRREWIERLGLEAGGEASAKDALGEM